jgi:hypothetical protein
MNCFGRGKTSEYDLQNEADSFKEVPMKLHIAIIGLFIIALLTALLVSGCGRHGTNLEETSMKLKAGMTESNVVTLFASFPDQRREYEAINIAFPTKRFQPNPYSVWSIIYYSNQKDFVGIQLSELCQVYFDANNIITEYRYMNMH